MQAARSVDAMATRQRARILALVAADHAVGFTLSILAAIWLQRWRRARAGVARFDEEDERIFEPCEFPILLDFGDARLRGCDVLWMMGREAEADAALARSQALAEDLKHAPSAGVQCSPSLTIL